jgi:RNA recognition motif 2
MLSVFGRIAAGRHVTLPQNAAGLVAHVFEFCNATHARMAVQAIGDRPGTAFSLHLVDAGGTVATADTSIRMQLTHSSASKSGSEASDGCPRSSNMRSQSYDPHGSPASTLPSLPGRSANGAGQAGGLQQWQNDSQQGSVQSGVSTSTSTSGQSRQMNLPSQYAAPSPNAQAPFASMSTESVGGAASAPMPMRQPHTTIAGPSLPSQLFLGMPPPPGREANITAISEPMPHAFGGGGAGGLGPPGTDGGDQLPMRRAAPGVQPGQGGNNVPTAQRTKRRMDALTTFDVNEAAAGGPRARTTVMVRNIPCRWTAEDFLTALKPIIGGSWNLLYMPCKMAEVENSGYAFLDFASSLGALRLYNAMHGRHWPNTRSGKVCEIRYARIQGSQLLSHLGSGDSGSAAAFRGYVAYPSDNQIVVHGPDALSQPPPLQHNQQYTPAGFGSGPAVQPSAQRGPPPPPPPQQQQPGAPHNSMPFAGPLPPWAAPDSAMHGSPQVGFPGQQGMYGAPACVPPDMFGGLPPQFQRPGSMPGASGQMGGGMGANNGNMPTGPPPGFMLGPERGQLGMGGLQNSAIHQGQVRPQCLLPRHCMRASNAR